MPQFAHKSINYTINNYNCFCTSLAAGFSNTDLSFLHMNIRSLSCHFDELQTLLVNLRVPFDVVAVSETWDSFKRPLKVNVEIPGYTFCPQDLKVRMVV